MSGTTKISVDNVQQYFSGEVITGIIKEEIKVITGNDNPFSGNSVKFGAYVRSELTT
ncbi:MAG: hypothetical protein LBP53_00455 [Candidatus Peribacteria bacterium]|jgi:hypothetical protein|nr:hypothetical protein [Candidatus Peribacteria bacterium]